MALHSCPDLLDDGIAGNPEHMTEAELAQAARSATFGAVDTLFVDIDDLVEGTLDPESGAITGDGQGVADEIARRVLASGGRVLAVRRDDVPHGNTAAALLRYAV